LDLHKQVEDDQNNQQRKRGQSRPRRTGLGDVLRGLDLGHDIVPLAIPQVTSWSDAPTPGAYPLRAGEDDFFSDREAGPIYGPQFRVVRVIRVRFVTLPQVAH